MFNIGEDTLSVKRDVKEFIKNNPETRTPELLAAMRARNHDTMDHKVLWKIGEAKGERKIEIPDFIAGVRAKGWDRRAPGEAAPNGSGGARSLATRAKANGKLEPDRDQIEMFVNAIFRHASPKGFVSVRSFLEDKSEKFRISPVNLSGGLRFLIDVAEDDARRAAQDPRPVVFCPPLAVFASKERARKQDIVEGLALSVECDQHPRQALKTLEAVLGPATVVVKSGGRWINGGPEAEDKLHLHWRLARTAQRDNLAKLELARDLATRIVGGDPSNKAVCHPIRWPGSWHRKAEPRLAKIESINADREIDLDAALSALTEAAKATSVSAEGDAQRTPGDEPCASPELIEAALEAIASGSGYTDEYHAWIRVGMAVHAATSGSEEGFALFDCFSAKFPEKYDADKTRAKWNSFKPTEIGAGTLIYMADDARPGWRDDYDARVEAEFTRRDPAAGAALRQHLRLVKSDEGAEVVPAKAAADTSAKPKAEPEAVELLSSAAFVRGFVPPDYLIDGLIQRQFFYSLTGKTGSGKTAIALLFAAFVALNRTMDGREFSRGRVLYLAGENPVDVQMRWIAMAEQTGFDIDVIDVHFIRGVFSVSEMASCIAEQVKALGGVSLVVIDTSAAYFEGDDENSNVQAGKYARMQRDLVTLPGSPAVLALCHPVKNAAEDNPLPRGGGSYLNEVDGNLTIQNSGGIAELHWQGKYRGPDFAPISFQLRTVTHERLKDSKGRTIPTVVASHLSEDKHKELKTVARGNEDALLAVLAGNPGASQADLARLAGWTTRNGEPYKVMVGRILRKLKKQKLVDEGRDGPELTEAGKKAVKAQKI